MHMKLQRHVYFLGVGGIGMSALARYLASRGHVVAGYDLTPSPLISELVREGIAVSLPPILQICLNGPKPWIRTI